MILQTCNKDKYFNSVCWLVFAHRVKNSYLGTTTPLSTINKKHNVFVCLFFNNSRSAQGQNKWFVFHLLGLHLGPPFQAEDENRFLAWGFFSWSCHSPTASWCHTWRPQENLTGITCPAATQQRLGALGHYRSGTAFLSEACECQLTPLLNTAAQRPSEHFDNRVIGKENAVRAQAFVRWKLQGKLWHKPVKQQGNFSSNKVELIQENEG